MEYPLVPCNFNQFPVHIQTHEEGEVCFCLKDICDSFLALISCPVYCNAFMFLLLILALAGCSEPNPNPILNSSEPQTNAELVGSNFTEVLEEYEKQLIQREEEKCGCKLLTEAEIAALTEKPQKQFAKLH